MNSHSTTKHLKHSSNFESVENVRSSNVVEFEFELELRHISTRDTHATIFHLLQMLVIVAFLRFWHCRNKCHDLRSWCSHKDLQTNLRRLLQLTQAEVSQTTVSQHSTNNYGMLINEMFSDDGSGNEQLGFWSHYTAW